MSSAFTKKVSDTNIKTCKFKWSVNETVDGKATDTSTWDVANLVDATHNTVNLDLVDWTKTWNVVATKNKVNGEDAKFHYSGSSSSEAKLTFMTNCYTFNKFNDISFKSPHVALEFNLRFHRIFDNVANSKALVRVARFVKMVSGLWMWMTTDGDTTFAYSQSLADTKDFYFHNIVGANTSQLCLLEIRNGVFWKLFEEQNSMLLTFLNQRLPVSESPTYPISKALDGVKAYAGYSD